jgi:hypothetical protein
MDKEITKDVLINFIEDLYTSKYDFNYKIEEDFRSYILVEIFKITPVGTVYNRCNYESYKEAIEHFKSLFDEFLKQFYISMTNNIINPMMDDLRKININNY